MGTRDKRRTVSTMAVAVLPPSGRRIGQWHVERRHVPADPEQARRDAPVAVLGGSIDLDLGD